MPYWYFGPSFSRMATRFRRVAADHALVLQRVLGAQVLPLDALDEILAVEQFGLGLAHAAGQQFVVERHLVAERLAHEDRRLQRAQVEARAHAVRPPELDVVGVVMRLLHHALVPRVPGLDAVIQAALDLRPQARAAIRCRR